jgi:hypothetical protein
MRTNHLAGGGGVFQKTGRETKNNIHVHCSIAAGSGLSHLQMYTIQVNSSWNLQADWILSGLTEGGRHPG